MDKADFLLDRILSTGQVFDDDELVDIAEAADLGGVTFLQLRGAISALPGFPDPVNKKPGAKRGRNLKYLRVEVLAWLETHDMLACIREVGRQRFNGSLSKPTDANDFSLMAKAFLTGAYATAEEKQRHEMKKLVARNFGGPTQRVTVRPDWMHD